MASRLTRPKRDSDEQVTLVEDEEFEPARAQTPGS
jgi:hypothetical protein